MNYIEYEIGGIKGNGSGGISEQQWAVNPVHPTWLALNSKTKTAFGVSETIDMLNFSSAVGQKDITCPNVDVYEARPFSFCPFCPRGKMTKVDGSGTCLDCEQGTFSYAGSSACLSCPENDEAVACDASSGDKLPGYGGANIIAGNWFQPAVLAQGKWEFSNATLAWGWSGDMTDVPGSGGCVDNASAICYQEIQEETKLYECQNPAACLVVPQSWRTICAEGYIGTRCAMCDTEGGWISEGPDTFMCRYCGEQATGGGSEVSSWTITGIAVLGAFLGLTAFSFVYLTKKDASFEDRATKKVALRWRRINANNRNRRLVEMQAEGARVALPWLTGGPKPHFEIAKVDTSRSQAMTAYANTKERNELIGDMGGVSKMGGGGLNINTSQLSAMAKNAGAQLITLKSQLANMSKILMGNLQILSGLTTVFTIPWPKEFSNFLSYLNAFKMDLMGMFTFVDACALQSSYFKGFTIQMLLLPGILICCLVAYFIARLRLTIDLHRNDCFKRRLRLDILNEVYEEEERAAVEGKAHNDTSGNVVRKKRRRSSLAESIQDKLHGTSEEAIEERETKFTVADYKKAWPFTYDAITYAFQANRTKKTTFEIARAKRALDEQNAMMDDAHDASAAWWVAKGIDIGMEANHALRGPFTVSDINWDGDFKIHCKFPNGEVHRYTESQWNAKIKYGADLMSNVESDKSEIENPHCHIMVKIVKSAHDQVATVVDQIVHARYSRASMKQRTFKLVNWIAFLVYPNLCSKIFTVFKCDDVDGELYFALDYSKKCLADDLEWNVFAGIAVFGMFIYVLGIPMATGLLLRSNWKRGLLYPSEGSGDSTTAYLDIEKYVAYRDTFNTYGDIYDQYEEEFWFFELLVMLYKMTLTGALILFRQGTSAQIVAGIVICFFWSVILAMFSPYDDIKDDILAQISGLQLFMTLLMGLALKSDMEDTKADLFGALIVGLNVITIATAAGIVCSNLPVLEKLFKREFWWKLARCKFHTCYHHNGCLYPCVGRIVHGIEESRGIEEVDDEYHISRRPFNGEIIKDQFFLNKLAHGYEEHAHSDTEQQLANFLGGVNIKGNAREGGLDMIEEELAEIDAWIGGGTRNVFGMGAATPEAQSKKRLAGLRAKMAVRLRTERLTEHLSYFFLCYAPEYVDSCEDRAKMYAGNGVEGEEMLNEELLETYGSDLSAVGEWLYVPLAERIEQFYGMYVPDKAGSGTAQAAAEYYEHDLDGLIERLHSGYGVSICNQIRDYEPRTLDETEHALWRLYREHVPEKMAAVHATCAYYANEVDELNERLRASYGTDLNAYTHATYHDKARAARYYAWVEETQQSEIDAQLFAKGLITDASIHSGIELSYGGEFATAGMVSPTRPDHGINPLFRADGADDVSEDGVFVGSNPVTDFDDGDKGSFMLKSDFGAGDGATQWSGNPLRASGGRGYSVDAAVVSAYEVEDDRDAVAAYQVNPMQAAASAEQHHRELREVDAFNEGMLSEALGLNQQDSFRETAEASKAASAVSARAKRREARRAKNKKAQQQFPAADEIASKSNPMRAGRGEAAARAVDVFNDGDGDGTFGGSNPMQQRPAGAGSVSAVFAAAQAALATDSDSEQTY
jgi:hypothetical protein